MSNEGYIDKDEFMDDIMSGNFNKSQYSDEFKNEKFYAQDLYYLKQAFISDNKNNIKKFLASYFSNMLFKMPKKLEEKLNCFYFDNEIPTAPYEEKCIKANDYCFESLREYLFKLYNLGFFNENIDLDFIYKKFDFKYNNPYTINLELFTAPPDDAIYFNAGMIYKNGMVSLMKDKHIVILGISLLNFIMGYREKKYVPINLSVIPTFDEKLLNFAPSYWEYLNESVYLNESKYTMCASEIFPSSINLDINSRKKYMYLSKVRGNLYCFKAIYNSILSEKFRYKVAEEYMKSDEVIYLEDNLRATHQYANIENIKSIDDNLKIRWIAEEILNFSISSIKGTLGTELLLTPFMLYKFLCFSQTRVVINFNKYGIWESFSRSAKDKSDLRLKLQTIVDVMFSINISDLDYHGISSRAIISNLLDRILNCLDFYKDEKSLKLFIKSSSYGYINFKDFVFNLNTGDIYHKQNILQDPNINFSTYNFTKYTLSNEELNVNYSNLCAGLNFDKYIDEYYYEFDINKMDEYLEEHFSIDDKSLSENIISNYKLCHQKFTKIYCNSQQEEPISDLADQEDENLNKEENTYTKQNKQKLNSFEEFLNSEPFIYFIADEKNDSQLLDNPLSEKSVKDYFKGKNIITYNQDVLKTYFNYCKDNDLEIEDFIKYYANSKKLRDNTGQSTEFNKKLTSYFRDKNFLCDKKILENKNPNIIEENIRGKVPLIFKDQINSDAKGYLGFCLKNPPVIGDTPSSTTPISNEKKAAESTPNETDINLNNGITNAQPVASTVQNLNENVPGNSPENDAK